MKPTLYMFIRKTFQVAFDISSNFGSPMMYMEYTKREAIKKYREDYGMKGKHIMIIDM